VPFQTAGADPRNAFSVNPRLGRTKRCHAAVQRHSLNRKKKKTHTSCATKPGHYDAHAFVPVVSPTSISPTRTMAAVVATSRKPAFNPFQFDRVATAPFIL
jgi:hypothetical protein